MVNVLITITNSSARLSRRGPSFDPRSGQVSWVRFFRGFCSPVRQMSGRFRPPRFPNIIWSSLSSSLIIHYQRQWPEMLMRPKTLNIHTKTSQGNYYKTLLYSRIKEWKCFWDIWFFFLHQSLRSYWCLEEQGAKGLQNVWQLNDEIVAKFLLFNSQEESLTNQPTNQPIGF